MMLRRSLIPLSLLSLAACSDLDHEVGVIEESADAAGVAGLVVDVGAGDLVVTGEAERETFDVVVRVRSAMGSDHNDQEVLDLTRVTFEDKGAGVHRLVVALPERYPAYTADVEVSVPLGQDVEVRDGSGDIVLGDLGALRVYDGSGDLVADHIDGSVEIRDGSGDIVLTNVRGNVRIDDGSGDVVVESVQGTVTVSDGSGDLTIRGADDVVLLEDGSGDVHID